MNLGGSGAVYSPRHACPDHGRRALSWWCWGLEPHRSWSAIGVQRSSLVSPPFFAVCFCVLEVNNCAATQLSKSAHSCPAGCRDRDVSAAKKWHLARQCRINVAIPSTINAAICEALLGSLSTPHWIAPISPLNKTRKAYSLS